MNLDKIRQQIKWIIEQIQCLKKHDCECERGFNLKTSLTDSPQGDNGAMIISENVKQISAYDAHLEFVDSPESTSGIPGHTVLKLKDEIAEQLSIQSLLNAQELNLGWKNGDIRINKNPSLMTVGVTDNVYTRNGYISYAFPTVVGGNLVYSTPTLEINNINNLIVDIPNFEKIKKYNPKLVITRFRNSKTKGPQEIGMIGSNHYSTAKFRVSKTNFPFRPSKISLNSGYQVIDIGQENYFNVLSYDDKIGPSTINMINTRGCGTRYSSKYQINGSIYNLKAWTYLEFRLEFTVGTKTYLSKPLNKVKLFLEMKVNYDRNNVINSKIKFKFA